jgi:hypothetical protein
MKEDKRFYRIYPFTDFGIRGQRVRSLFTPRDPAPAEYFIHILVSTPPLPFAACMRMVVLVGVDARSPVPGRPTGRLTCHKSHRWHGCTRKDRPRAPILGSGAVRTAERARRAQMGGICSWRSRSRTGGADPFALSLSLTLIILGGSQPAGRVPLPVRAQNQRRGGARQQSSHGRRPRRQEYSKKSVRHAHLRYENVKCLFTAARRHARVASRNMT